MILPNRELKTKRLLRRLLQWINFIDSKKDSKTPVFQLINTTFAPN